MNSLELVRQCDGLTYRKLDNWCRQGVFGDEKVDTGSGARRSFDDDDCRVARTLSHVSVAFDRWSGGRGGMLPVYGQVAIQVRAGSRVARVRLAAGITVEVDLDAMGVS